jgi:hypothetical protein
MLLQRTPLTHVSVTPNQMMKVLMTTFLQYVCHEIANKTFHRLKEVLSIECTSSWYSLLIKTKPNSSRKIHLIFELWIWSCFDCCCFFTVPWHRAGVRPDFVVMTTLAQFCAERGDVASTWHTIKVAQRPDQPISPPYVIWPKNWLSWSFFSLSLSLSLSLSSAHVNHLLWLALFSTTFDILFMTQVV